ncbi:hypothetical protein KCP69_22495 [Salmonella enterica subsp. enterica]|nr:hypothetical protein KCP69_22495 [Salmonella enterica subsp. enterica]
MWVLTATGYFYTACALAGRWIETVYLVIIWNHRFYRNGAARVKRRARVLATRAGSRRQNFGIKEGGRRGATGRTLHRVGAD